MFTTRISLLVGGFVDKTVRGRNFLLKQVGWLTDLRWRNEANADGDKNAEIYMMLPFKSDHQKLDNFSSPCAKFQPIPATPSPDKIYLN